MFENNEIVIVKDKRVICHSVARITDSFYKRINLIKGSRVQIRNKLGCGNCYEVSWPGMTRGIGYFHKDDILKSDLQERLNFKYVSKRWAYYNNR